MVMPGPIDTTPLSGGLNSVGMFDSAMPNNSYLFSQSEIQGKTFQFTGIDYPTGSFMLTFNSNGTMDKSDDPNATFTYTVADGVINITDNFSESTTLEVYDRSGSTIIASLGKYNGSFVDKTDQWAADFSTLNNDATALKDWFIANGWWPGSALLADGSVTNQEATFEGKWWINGNVLFILYPEATCIDYKAYKLVNNRLMFTTLGHSELYNMIQL